MVFAGGFFEAVAFFAAFASAFFFIFMGRTVQQPHGAGQVNANAITMESRYGNVTATNSSGTFAPFDRKCDVLSSTCHVRH